MVPVLPSTGSGHAQVSDVSYFDASRLWVLHSMSVEVSREPSFPEWEERTLRWPQGTVVASSWQGLRCQPCCQFHALGTRGREEQSVFLTNGSVVPTLNNRTQTPLPRLLVQGAKIKDSKDTKDLIPPQSVVTWSMLLPRQQQSWASQLGPPSGAPSVLFSTCLSWVLFDLARNG